MHRLHEVLKSAVVNPILVIIGHDFFQISEQCQLVTFTLEFGDLPFFLPHLSPSLYVFIVACVLALTSSVLRLLRLREGYASAFAIIKPIDILFLFTAVKKKPKKAWWYFSLFKFGTLFGDVHIQNFQLHSSIIASQENNDKPLYILIALKKQRKKGWGLVRGEGSIDKNVRNNFTYLYTPK